MQNYCNKDVANENYYWELGKLGCRRRCLKRALIADIVHLSRLFFDLSESKCIKVSLEPVSNDMCRIFHVDNIKQRMICTYKGQGTEWLTESNLNRTGLGGGDNKKIVKDFDLVRRAEAFEVLLLKGKKAESPIGGAVHRSPEIHSSAQTRVLLKIDECCWAHYKMTVKF